MRLFILTAANAAAFALAAFFFATTVSHYAPHAPACAPHQTACSHGPHVVVSFGKLAKV